MSKTTETYTYIGSKDFYEDEESFSPNFTRRYLNGEKDIEK